MKKIFSLVLVLALTLALGIPALAAEADETAVPEITLSADAEKVPAGKTVTLTLSLTGELKDINSFEYYIRYDPAVVELAESKAGAASDLTKIGTPPRGELQDRRGGHLQGRHGQRREARGYRRVLHDRGHGR